jgi:putative flavoprotein involved in K+ transport
MNADTRAVLSGPDPARRRPRPRTDRCRTTDILVIGAGQAALALAYHLRDLPYRFTLVDRHARIGDSWRNRYDSLTLFTPRSQSALPGRAVPGDPEGLPTKDEIADYLEDYARHFAFPVLPGTEIRSLERVGGGFCATTRDGRVLRSRAVVLANGAFQVPVVPALACTLSRGVRQFTAADYRRPDQVPPGNVLVVGDGASGRQIARELAATHRTFLAVGRPRKVIPERLLGKNIIWWMARLGLFGATKDSFLGRFLRRADPVPGRQFSAANLARSGVTMVPRLTGAHGTSVRFADGGKIDIASVVWTAGYREDTGWLNIPEAFDQRLQLAHRRGITPVPGLYLLGRAWQSNRGSALLLGVARDARFIAERLRASLEIQFGEMR